MLHARDNEKGLVTVAMSLGLLLLASIMTLYTTRTALMEQRVSSNDYRIKQAFEAADAGLNMGVMHLLDNRSTILVDTDDDGYVDSYTHTAISSASLPNNTGFTVTISNPVVNDMTIITVSSEGHSIDGEVSRVVAQNYSDETILKGEPPTPFTAKGNVTLSGNLRIVNGHTDTSIWSGGAVGFSGASRSCNSAVCSDSRSTEYDVSANDATLAALSDTTFFENFFGGPMDVVKRNAHMYFNNAVDTNYSSDLDGVTNKVIYIDQTAGEAQINSNITMGSAAEPVVLIIDGDFHLNGTAVIYGVVYVNNTWNNSGGGTLNVRGSVIVNGDFTGTGTPNVAYTPDVLLKTVTNLGYFNKVAGSWRDF